MIRENENVTMTRIYDPVEAERIKLLWDRAVAALVLQQNVRLHTAELRLDQILDHDDETLERVERRLTAA